MSNIIYILGLIKEKRTSEARKVIENIRFENTGMYYYYMGLSYCSEGDYQQAENCMKLSEELGLKNYALFYNLGVIYMEMMDYYNAEIYLKKSNDINKGFISNYINLAYIYCYRNDYKGAYRVIKTGMANTQSNDLEDLEQKLFHMI